MSDHDSMSQPKRIGVIDLGSNTARLVVFSAVPGYAFRLEDEIREVVRLRQGMTKRGMTEEAIARGFSTLRLFKRFCDATQVETILPVATSAVRDAANGATFVGQVQREIGLSLRVLDGEQEAYYGVLGVLNGVPVSAGMVLDIGGGSAQLSEVRNRRFYRGQSLRLGALALTERFVESDPISETEFEAVQDEIDRQLGTIPWLEPDDAPLIGMGGTIRNLARIEAERQSYPLNTLHGFALSRDSVEETLDLLRTLPLKKRRDIPGLNRDRADIILPGVMVVRAVMEHLGVEGMTVSVNGLREGVFFEHFWEHLPYPVIYDVRRFSLLNMARLYHYQKQHANHVRYLAGRLFEQLASLHGYGKPEREILDAAAVLHDLGVVIDYEYHHKHTETLIANRGLPGYTPREIALIALIARYHRRGRPKTLGYDGLLHEGDELLLMRLAAILRMAEYLERGRNGIVDDVIVSPDGEGICITLIADEYPAVELWQAEHNAVPLFEAAFERPTRLQSIAAPLPG
jgi:exopolyphosphatase/guanosine-5'-triphosphate,3'-diphosphate pyrophosphatase